MRDLDSHPHQVVLAPAYAGHLFKALRNSKAVAEKHYLKPTAVLPDVRKAVNEAVSGLVQTSQNERLEAVLDAVEGLRQNGSGAR